MKKRFKTLGEFYFILILFISFNLLLTKVVFKKEAEGTPYPPFQVTISNFGPRSFTVSWLTSGKTTGAVFLKETQKVYEDTRGPAIWSKIHWVNVENLEPEKEYSFGIKSGSDLFLKNLDGQWRKEGFFEKIKTPKDINFNPNNPISSTNTPGAYSLEENAWEACPDGTFEGKIFPCFRPNLIWGTAIDNNNRPIKEALIFLEIPGNSTVLSTLTNNKGRWAFNLANLYKEDLTGYLSYNPEEDLLRLKGLDEEENTYTGYHLIPSVGKNKDLTNPLTIRLTSLPFSPTPSQIPPKIPTLQPISPSPFKTGSQPSSTTYLEIKVKFQGIDKKGPDRLINIFLKRSENELDSITKEVKFQSDEVGVYFGRVDSLKIGKFDIILKSKNYLSKKIVGIEIKTGTNPLDITNSPFLAGDLNDDNRIDIQDLGILLSEYGSFNPKEGIADLNSDGLVNSQDLGMLLTNYRQEGDK